MEKKNKTPKEELTPFEKRYKRLRWAQHVLFWISILTATVPAVVVALNTGLVFQEASNEEGEWRLAGFAIFVLAIGALLMLKGLRDKFRDKMPWSVTAAVGSWVMTGFIYAIHKIVEDALWISLALAIGCTVASVLSAISDLCKTQADAMESEYYRRQK
jgi:hypothetical protein